MGAAREGGMVRDKGFYWDLFVATLQLSAFTVGGGFVIVPLMRRKFIREKQWLDEDEMLTHIVVPKVAKSSFRKFALRKSIDFPVVNCAVAQAEDGSVKVALGGVYPSPIRSAAAEEAVAAGVTEESAAAAGDAAVKDAKPLPKNEYKVEITRTIVKRTLLEIAG